MGPKNEFCITHNPILIGVILTSPINNQFTCLTPPKYKVGINKCKDGRFQCMRCDDVQIYIESLGELSAEC